MELQTKRKLFHAQPHVLAQIPVFDLKKFHQGKYANGSLVRFRGVICDLRDPELMVLHENAHRSEHQRSDFTERVPCKVKVLDNLTPWARDLYYGNQPEDQQTVVTKDEDTTTTAPTRKTKRSQDEENEQPDNDVVMKEYSSKDHAAVQQTSVQVEQEPNAGVSSGSKKAKPSAAAATTTATTKDAEEQADVFADNCFCLYVYDDFPKDTVSMEQFKVNESFEFVGLLDLSVDGALDEAMDDDQDKADPSTNHLKELQNLQICELLESKPHADAAVFHCCDAIALQNLHHVKPHQEPAFYNSFQPQPTSQMKYFEQMLASKDVSNDGKLVKSPFVVLREQLIQYLQSFVLGDELAAEYLLLALLSHVYARVDKTTPLGNLSLNLVVSDSSESCGKEVVIALQQAIANLMPCMTSLDLSIASLNERDWIPHKNYDTEVLRSACLQLPQGSVLVVDETAMTPGTLNSKGLQNMQALQALVHKMVLPYEFQYFQMEFPQDVVVLSVSNTKSILPMTVSVPIDSPASSCARPEVSMQMLNCLREFLAITRLNDVPITNEEADRAEKCFVSERQRHPEVNSEDLHRWLRIARLVAMSFGDASLSNSSWQHALQLEKRRSQRSVRSHVPTKCP